MKEGKYGVTPKVKSDHFPFAPRKRWVIQTAD